METSSQNWSIIWPAKIRSLIFHLIFYSKRYTQFKCHRHLWVTKSEGWEMRDERNKEGGDTKGYADTNGLFRMDIQN